MPRIMGTEGRSDGTGPCRAVVCVGVASDASVGVRPYEKQDAQAWDALVAGSWNGTFLHERRFLAYHGERFRDMSLVLEDRRGRLVGVFPAALDPEDKKSVVSHPGLTYGGVVHGGSLQGTATLEALQAMVKAYRGLGLRSLRYKVVPYIYQNVPSADDLYALFRLGATRYRCDLSAAINLASAHKRSKLRMRDLNKARRAGVRVAVGPGYLEAYWAVLEENLATRHGARPVHNLEEIKDLQHRFPERIECIVGVSGDEVVAGVVLFNSSRVAHVQYSASSALGNAVAAQTMVVAYAIERSRAANLSYFDFGVSNEHDGRVLNEGLYGFKTSFGAGGVVHEFYEVNLEVDPASERGGSAVGTERGCLS